MVQNLTQGRKTYTHDTRRKVEQYSAERESAIEMKNRFFWKSWRCRNCVKVVPEKEGWRGWEDIAPGGNFCPTCYWNLPHTDQREKSNLGRRAISLKYFHHLLLLGEFHLEGASFWIELSAPTTSVCSLSRSWFNASYSGSARFGIEFNMSHTKMCRYTALNPKFANISSFFVCKASIVRSFRRTLWSVFKFLLFPIISLFCLDQRGKVI